MADDIVFRLFERSGCTCPPSFPFDADPCDTCCDRAEAASLIEELRTIGDRLAEQVMLLLGPLSTDADSATVERHRIVRAGALAEWAEVRRG